MTHLRLLATKDEHKFLLDYSSGVGYDIAFQMYVGDTLVMVWGRLKRRSFYSHKAQPVGRVPCVQGHTCIRKTKHNFIFGC